METVLGKAGLAALVFGFWGASPHPGIIEGLSLFLFSQTGSAIHTVNGDSGDVLHTPRGSPIWSLVVRRKNSSGCLFIAGSFQSDTTGIASFEIGRVCLVYSTTWWSNKGLKVTLYVNFGFTR